MDVAMPLSQHLQQVEPGLTPAQRVRGPGGLHSPIMKGQWLSPGVRGRNRPRGELVNGLTFRARQFEKSFLRWPQGITHPCMHMKSTAWAPALCQALQDAAGD